MANLRPFINSNDRLTALLDMGVSPGEDDSYDVQAKKLMDQKDKLIDNTKRNVLDRLESMIRSNRNLKSPEGPLNPIDFVKETLAKSIPSPSEVNPINIAKSIPPLASAALEVAKHPLASAKQAFLNGPPDPSTVASMLLPGAALKAYRETVPLAGRVYLHHMAGVPTPFSHVTDAERTALTEMAQSKLDHLLKVQGVIDKNKSFALKRINDIKLMNKAELIQYAEENSNLSRHPIYNSDGTYKDIKEIRDGIIAEYKSRYPSVFMGDENNLKARGYLGQEEDNANVRDEFQKITGKQLRATPIPDTEDFATAFGKTYVEPMVDKTTGRIVPKAIKDTYKFYPEVYNYEKGQGFKSIIDQIRGGIEDLKEPSLLYAGEKFSKLKDIRDRIQTIFSPNAGYPLGILARKLGMRRPTSIIDIPLQAPPLLNAYDKAAILLGAKQLAKKEE